MELIKDMIFIVLDKAKVFCHEKTPFCVGYCFSATLIYRQIFM